LVEEIVRRKYEEQMRGVALGLLKRPYMPMAALDSWYLKWLKTAEEAGVKKETFDDVFMDVIDISLIAEEMEDQLKAAIPILAEPLTDTEREYREALREQALDAAKTVKEALEARIITPAEAGLYRRAPKDAEELIRLRGEVERLKKELEEYKKKVRPPPIARPPRPPPPPYIASSSGEEWKDDQGILVMEGEYGELMEEGYLDEEIEQVPKDVQVAPEIPEYLKGLTVAEARRYIPELRRILEYYLVKMRETRETLKHRLRVDRRRISDFIRLTNLEEVARVSKKRVPVMGRMTAIGEAPKIYRDSIDGYDMEVFCFPPTKELAYIVGLAVADGRKYIGVDEQTGVRKSAYIAIIGEIDRKFEERILEKVLKILEHMNNTYKELTGRDMPYKDKKYVTIRYRKHQQKELSPSPEGKKYFEIAICNSYLARLVWDHNAQLRYDVLERFRREPELLKEFIAGLWDGDGEIKDYRPEFSQALVRKWKEMLVGWLKGRLSEMGLDVRSYVMKERYTKTIRGYSEVVEKADVAVLYVAEANREVWFREIGTRMQHTEKREIVREFLRRAPWTPPR